MIAAYQLTQSRCDTAPWHTATSVPRQYHVHNACYSHGTTTGRHRSHTHRRSWATPEADAGDVKSHNRHVKIFLPLDRYVGSGLGSCGPTVTGDTLTGTVSGARALDGDPGAGAGANLAL